MSAECQSVCRSFQIVFRVRNVRLGLCLLAACFLVILLGSAYSLNAEEQGDTSHQPGTIREGELILQLEAGKRADDIVSGFEAIELVPVKLLSRRMNIWLFEYTLSQEKTDIEVLDDVRAHPAVSIGQFNHYIQERATIPDDTRFNEQWALNNTGQTGGTVDADIDAPEAWDIVTGGTTELGDVIVVAIVDGGCDLNHPDIDFFKNENEIPNNGIDDDGNGYVDDYDGWDAYSSDGSIPSSTHGTHVAGIAAAIGNNSLGVSGVNWGAKVMPIAGSSSNESTVIEAYGYVLEMRASYNETDGAYGAFVVSTNASFGVDYGNPDNYPLWCGIYDSLGEAGVLNMGATANLNIDIDVTGDVPTACPSDYMIAVTNTTHTDVKNGGAAYGLTTIDLGAPGTSILSTVPGSSYSTLTGTSMATPQVCGAVALMYAAACPSLIQAYRSDPGGIALLMKQYLLDSTDPNASLAGITVSGGRLNIYNAVLAVQTYPCGVGIYHTPLTDTREFVNPYEVICSIISDTALVEDSLLLHYEISSVDYLDTLEPTLNPDEYHAFIPAQAPGTVIDYYLFAINVDGDADTTEVFTFRVIDYDITLEAAGTADTGSVDDTLWYDFVVTNEGTLDDDIGLTVSGDTWPTGIYDQTGTTPISSTGSLTPLAQLSFKVRVIIPTSAYGDVDMVTVSATSGGDPSVTSEVVLSTMSLGEPFSIPFTDAFLTTVIDIGRWIYYSGAEVNSVGLNEPSDPYSLNLDGGPSGGDTIFSQHIDLSGESSVIVRYYYERTGDGDSPEVGDNLYVDYMNDSGFWLNLKTHLGDGPDMDQYEEETISLPVDAHHSEFRLRLRSKGTSGSFDDWFIDDIYVGLPSSYEVRISPSFQEQYGSVGDTASFFVFVKNRGVLSDDYSLVDSASSWNVSFWDGLNSGQITSTGTIASGDSVEVLIKIEVPSGAPLNSADTAIVKAVSTGDPMMFAEAMIVTISAGAAASVPWFEPFASGSVDMSIWMLNIGGEIASNSYSPPSSPYALQLDGGIDTLVSQLIDLSDQAGALFTYYYEQTGPGASPGGGDDLVFEYKNSSAIWVEMSRQLGSASDMTSFEFVEIPLPGDAMHKSFQIRLTSSGSGEGSDDWYIDDLSVDFAPSVTVSPSSLMFLLESGESADAELLISNGGPGTLNYSVSNIPIFDKSSTFGRLLSLGQVEPARPSFAEGAFDGYVDVKGSEDSREGPAVRFDAGGPDDYGYVWVDSDEPGGPQYDWVDVQSTGTLVSDLLDTGSDDDYAGPFPIGFTFSYYGVAYTEFYISSNGFVGFGPPDRYNARTNWVLPTPETPNNILAWCWDDLNPVDANNPGAGIYYDSDGSRLVIQFVDLPHYAAQSGDVINAEVILYANGRIRYQYQDIAPGFDVLSATVGIENSDGDDGLTVVFNAAYLKNSLAVEFAAPAQWLTVSPSEGSVAPTESDTVSVHVVSTGLDDGDYVTQLHVNSNDPDPGENPWIVLVDLTVTSAPTYICGDADGSMSVDIDDAVFIIQYIFGGGPPPDPIESGDADCSGGIDIDDAVFLIQYIFSGGNEPCDTDGDEVPDC